MSDSADRRRVPPWVWVAVMIAVGVWRLGVCLELPSNTGDVLRHALYGVAVGEQGLGAADLRLIDLDPGYRDLSWSWLRFNYPIGALLFDAAVMKVWPTLFSLKLALTLLELASALLIWRATGERWLALVYWASPVSVWWISHEGQIEALQNVFAIAAVVALPRRRALAWVLLALAIQCKLFAVFLLPWFLASAWRGRTWGRDAAAFVLGFLPTALGFFFYSPLANFRITGALRYNPYYWNFFDRDLFLWNPTWLIAIDQLASYGLIVLLLVLVRRSADKAAFVSPLGFLVALKAFVHGQFWYVAALPSFLLPIRERRWRWLAFLLVPLLDVSSLIQIVSGPFGYVVSGELGRITTLTLLN